MNTELVGYEEIWREDDATMRIHDCGYVTPSMKYKELTGESELAATVLQVIDNGDWYGEVLSTGYIVAGSPMGGSIHKLPDVLTVAEMEAMVDALGGPEFFVSPCIKNRAIVSVHTPVSVWPSLARRGFAKALRTPLDLIDGFEYEVTAKGKAKLTYLYKKGRTPWPNTTLSL